MGEPMTPSYLFRNQSISEYTDIGRIVYLFDSG